MRIFYANVPAFHVPSKSVSGLFQFTDKQNRLKKNNLQHYTATTTTEKATTAQPDKNNRFTGVARLLISLILLLGMHGLVWGQTAQTFTSNGTFNLPNGVTGVTVELWGGGGGGGGAYGGSGILIPIGRGGGGAGGAFVRNYTAVSANVPVTVGTGGAGGVGNVDGTSGGNSTFLTLSASGGAAGKKGDGENGAGGAATTGITFNGGAGSAGDTSSGAGGGGAGNGGSGGNATGGSGGAAGTGTVAGGIGAQGRTSNNDGNPATALSAGGGGGYANVAFGTNKNGGAGFRGQVIVYYYQFTGVTATSVTVGSPSIVTVKATATNLPVGTYTVTYNLTGANTATSSTATLTVNTAGTGTFSTSALATVGLTTVTITSITNGTYSGGIGANNTANFNVTGTVTSTMAANTVPAASVCAGSLKVPVQSFTIAQAVSIANLTGLTFTTTGTYTATDISNFKLWTNTTNNLSTATQLGTNITTALGTGSHSFAAFTQALTSGSTRYFWITMDVAASPVSGHTLGVNALGITDFTVNTGNKTGSSTTGGTQTINTPPAITIHPSTGSQTLCVGGTAVTLSVTATGTAPLTYQWYSNTSSSNSGGTLISGATSSGYTPSAAVGGTLYYYCVVTGSCGSATTNVSGGVTVNAANTWTGSSGTLWSTPANWSCGAVPVAASNVVIPATANKPVVDITTAVCNNLDIASGATLTINAGKALTVGGVITGCSTPADAGKIQVKATTAAAPTVANGTLIINCAANSISPGVPKSIYATVDLFAKGQNGLPYSWTDNILGSPTDGKVTYVGGYRWQHFGVPVKEVVANPTFYGAYLRKYDETINAANSYYQKWVNLTNESKLEKFRGYEITQDAKDAPATYQIRGELVFCDQTITLTHQAPAVSGSTDTNEYNRRYGLGQNIFGNSFTASIPIDKIIFPDDVEKVVYMYNTGTFGEWANTSAPVSETTMTAGTYIAIPKSTASSLDYGKIPSMQGFLLIHLGSTDAPISMQIPYADVAVNTKPQLSPQENDATTTGSQAYLKINLQSKSTIDNLWLFSREGTTNKIDDGWDGRKYFGTPTAFIYTENADGPMQVSTDKTIDGTVLNFYANEDTEYTLTLTKSNLDDYRNLHLIDLRTRTSTPLTGDVTTYHFTADSKGNVEKRFIIANSAFIDLNSDKFKFLDGYVMNNNRLIISNFTTVDGVMHLCDISGKTLINRKISPSVSEIPVSLQSGVYILSLQANGRHESIKLIIK